MIIERVEREGVAREELAADRVGRPSRATLAALRGRVFATSHHASGEGGTAPYSPPALGGGGDTYHPRRLAAAARSACGRGRRSATHHPGAAHHPAAVVRPLEGSV